MHHRIVSDVKRVDFVSGRVLYIVLRGRWCNIIILIVHAQVMRIVMIQIQFLRIFRADFFF